MSGGAGNDTYVIRDVGFYSYNPQTGQLTPIFDSVVEQADAGTDTLQLWSSVVSRYVIDANVENAVILENAACNVTGNDLGNAMSGNDAANTFSGLAGWDRIDGNGGDDTLDGGTGFDDLRGGSGNDTYVIADAWTYTYNPATGSLTPEFDAVTEAIGAGNDTLVLSSAVVSQYTINANVENAIVSGTGACNVTGNELANRINGNGAINILSGGLGDDRHFRVWRCRPSHWRRRARPSRGWRGKGYHDRRRRS